MKQAHGFTLLEVLAALALLSLLLLGVYAGVSSATHTVHAGAVKIEQLDQIRSAQMFLRRELEQVMIQPLARDDNNNFIYFSGSADEMRFIAPLPGYLGHMGPQLIDLKLVDGEHGRQLVASLGVLQPGQPQVKPLGDPQVLVEGITSGGFRYRGVNQQGQVTDWQDDWTLPGRIPNLVDIDIKLDGGRAWPDLTAPLRVGSATMQGGLLRGVNSGGVMQ